MEKVITLEGKEMRLRANALIPRKYRFFFGRDLVQDMQSLVATYNKDDSAIDFTVFENLAWLMLREGGEDVGKSTDEWLATIDDTFAVYELIPEVIELWKLNTKTTANQKKIKQTIREPNGSIFLLRCTELNLSDEALSEMTMGMVYDLLTEKANDMEDYPAKATQDDIRSFFGQGIIMATKIRGITIELNGDTSGLEKSLKGVNSKINSTQKELKDVEKLLKLDPTNTELLEQKQKLLADAVQLSKEKLDDLHEIEKNLKENGVDENSEQFRALQRES